jgi:hypothetical protein
MSEDDSAHYSADCRAVFEEAEQRKQHYISIEAGRQLVFPGLVDHSRRAGYRYCLTLAARPSPGWSIIFAHLAALSDLRSGRALGSLAYAASAFPIEERQQER